jgi:hypothetical protein
VYNLTVPTISNQTKSRVECPGIDCSPPGKYTYQSIQH